MFPVGEIRHVCKKLLRSGISLDRESAQIDADHHCDVGVTSFFLSFPLFYRLRDRSPHSPLPATQQVHELSDHGYLFYVTREEYWLFYGLLYGGWGLGALAAVLNWRWKVIHNLTPEGWQLPK